MSTTNACAKVPKEVVVGPFQYKIDFDAEASYDYSYLGVALFRSKRIKLDPRQSDTELPQTFLHEILHALGNTYEIEVWDHHAVDQNGTCLDQIDLMATALLEFMRRNPKAIKWLIETKGKTDEIKK